MIYLVLIVGLILRLINLNQSLWLDEAIEILAVKTNSFAGLWTTYPLGDFHPPFYHLLLKAWVSLFGYSEISGRMLSVLFGVGTIWFVYLIGKNFFGKKGGIIAASFLAINPLAIYYSQEARMYALATFAIVGSFYFFLQKKWFWFGLFLAAALYTDYVPYLLIPVYILLSFRKIRPVSLTFLAVAISLLAWLPQFYRQLQVGLEAMAAAPGWGKVVGGFDWKALPLTWVKFIVGRISLENKWLYGLLIIPVSLYYFWLMIKNREVALWLWLVIPLVLGFLVSVFIPIYSYFRFLFVLPAFVLLLAGGAIKKRFGLVLVTTVSVVSLTIFNLFPLFWRENWRGFVRYVQSNPGRSLVAIPSLAQAPPIKYYDDRIMVEDKNNLHLGNVQTVYLLRYVQEIFDPADTLRRTLETDGYRFSQQRNFNGVVVWKYQK